MLLNADYSWKLTFNIVNIWFVEKFITSCQCHFEFTGRFSLAIFSIKPFVNDGMSTRLRCQNSEEIEAVLEDSAMMFSSLTRVASLSCKHGGLWLRRAGPPAWRILYHVIVYCKRLYTINNSVKLSGWWEPGISMGLHCDPPAPRQ